MLRDSTLVRAAVAAIVQNDRHRAVSRCPARRRRAPPGSHPLRPRRPEGSAGRWHRAGGSRGVPAQRTPRDLPPSPELRGRVASGLRFGTAHRAALTRYGECRGRIVPGKVARQEQRLPAPPRAETPCHDSATVTAISDRYDRDAEKYGHYWAPV